MDDRMRVSDADRERVAARLRDHFAEGRLTSEELDERISAALSAKTVGDLRPIMADLPEPGQPPTAQGGSPDWTAQPGWTGRPRPAFRRGPRLMPLVLGALILWLLLSGAHLVFFGFFGLFKVILVIWLVMAVLGIFAARSRRRRARRRWQSGQRDHWHQHDWHP
jgi:hypothetical protein